LGPVKQHVIPPQHYAVVKDPVVRVKNASNDNDDDDDNDNAVTKTFADMHTNRHGRVKVIY
jgi:hypothetical protein